MRALSGLQTGALSLFPHMGWGGGVGRGHISKLSDVYFYKGNNPTLMILSKPNYLLKAPSSNTITLGVMASIYECRGDTTQSTSPRFREVSLPDQLSGRGQAKPLST